MRVADLKLCLKAAGDLGDRPDRTLALLSLREKAMRAVLRSLGLLVIGSVLLAACSSGHLGAVHRASPTATTAPSLSGCAKPMVLGSGQSIGAARLGAIEFLTKRAGVAVSAAVIPCEIPGYGIVARSQPALLARTDDGGAHWVTEGSPIPSKLTAGTQVVAQVVAASSSVLWVLNRVGTLLKTNDRGTRWTTQPLPIPVDELARVDGWLWALACSPPTPTCARPVLEKVPLAGGRWQRLKVPWPTPSTFNRLNVVSDEVVILASSDGGAADAGLLASTDGSQTWTVHRPPSGPGGLCVSYPEFSADSPSDWWLLCVGGAAAGSSTKALMRSTDGGQTWVTVAALPSLIPPHPPGSLSADEPAALAAASPSRIWLAGVNVMTESTDGGVTWTVVPGVRAEGSTTGSFDVLSPSEAWLLAPGVGLWSTSNGTSWHPLDAVTPY